MMWYLLFGVKRQIGRKIKKNPKTKPLALQEQGQRWRTQSTHNHRNDVCSYVRKQEILLRRSSTIAHRLLFARGFVALTKEFLFTNKQKKYYSPWNTQIHFLTLNNLISQKSRSSLKAFSLIAMADAALTRFLLDIKGWVLIWRDYRGDVSTIQAEQFFTKLIEKEVWLLLNLRNIT